MRPGPVIAEVTAWSLFFPVAIVLMIRRKLGYGYQTTEGRVDALLEWYPAPWRARHGERLTELLSDAIDDGRGNLRMSLDVAREGVVERRRDFRWRRVWAALLVTVGWIMVVPQGIIAPILGLFDAPATWFVALYFDGGERWLVAGAMVGVGLLLIDRGVRLGARIARCARPATGRRPDSARAARRSRRPAGPRAPRPRSPARSRRSPRPTARG